MHQDAKPSFVLLNAQVFCILVSRLDLGSIIHINQFILNNRQTLSNKSKRKIKCLQNISCEMCNDKSCETSEKIA